MDIKPLDPSVHSWHWFTMTGGSSDDLLGGCIILLWNADTQRWHNTLNSAVATATRSSYIGPVAKPYTTKELQFYKIKRIWDNTPGLTTRVTLISMVRNTTGLAIRESIELVKEALAYWADHEDMKAYELLDQFDS